MTEAYNVWVNGVLVNNNPLSKPEADALASHYRAHEKAHVLVEFVNYF